MHVWRSSQCTKRYDMEYKGALFVVAVCIAAAQGNKDPHCIGTREAIVHLFEWTWDDVTYECENFLGPMGYCAVQISPPNENRMIVDRPWWERYQPVSYMLVTRSGDEDAFRNMVDRCNNAGVRIYADIILNHMSTNDSGHGTGTGGSYYDADRRYFPGVPYTTDDFHGREVCHTFDGALHDNTNKDELRLCRLGTLLDLSTESEYVKRKETEYLNHLVSTGVMGFRVDASTHMYPEDLQDLFSRVKDVKVGGRPFVYQEVIDKGGNESVKGGDYLGSGRILNFKFGMQLAEILKWRQNSLKNLVRWGEPYDVWRSGDVVNFIDNHDNQRDESDFELTHWDGKPYRAATAFMLAHPYGMPRIMSSYEYDRSNRNIGPPSYPGTNDTKPVLHYGNKCGNGWSCEHRWRQSYQMVAFRNMAKGAGVNNWWHGLDNQIAFSREDKAFIVFNFEHQDLRVHLQTGLAEGRYCNIVTSVMKDRDTCVKEEDNEKGMNIVEVGRDGVAAIWVPHDSPDMFLAIHIGAKLGKDPRTH